MCPKRCKCATCCLSHVFVSVFASYNCSSCSSGQDVAEFFRRHWTKLACQKIQGFPLFSARFSLERTGICWIPRVSRVHPMLLPRLLNSHASSPLSRRRSFEICWGSTLGILDDQKLVVLTCFNYHEIRGKWRVGNPGDSIIHFQQQPRGHLRSWKLQLFCGLEVSMPVAFWIHFDPKL